MKVIAATDGGVLIEATRDEVAEILCSVTGQRPEKISIGQKIPAIDYASSITKTKALEDDFHFNQVRKNLQAFVTTFEKLSQAIEEASNIEL